jgi:hypothetical protein
VSSGSTSEVQTCEQCGFSWDRLTRAEISRRIGDAVETIVAIVVHSGVSGATRPSPGRWSTLEYAGHLRDVLVSIRERIVLASIVDVPVGQPIFRDERIDLGFYTQDTASDVAAELQVMTYLFLKTVATLPDGFEGRKLVYSTRTPVEITISGAMLNALHECEHHLGDIQANVRLLELTTS